MGDPARLENQYAESVGAAAATPRLTNEYVEVIRDPVEITPYARLTNQYVEVVAVPLTTSGREPRLTNQYVEVVIPLRAARRRSMPVVNITGARTTVLPGTGNVVITGHAPTISGIGVVVQPATGHVTVTGHQPTVTVGTLSSKILGQGGSSFILGQDGASNILGQGS